jgi:hypothetical protein
MIIGLSGYAKSGKNTVAKLIKQARPEYEEKSFATNLKVIAHILTGYPIEYFEEQEFKESSLPEEWSNGNKTMTIRELLQKLGTDAVRCNVHENAWVNALFTNYKKSDNWIITDVRFANEADKIKKLGGVIIRITRGKPVNSHISEIALDDYKFDYEIMNTGSFDDLNKLVNYIVNLIDL